MVEYFSLFHCLFSQIQKFLILRINQLISQFLRILGSILIHHFSFLHLLYFIYHPFQTLLIYFQVIISSHCLFNIISHYLYINLISFHFPFIIIIIIIFHSILLYLISSHFLCYFLSLLQISSISHSLSVLYQAATVFHLHYMSYLNAHLAQIFLQLDCCFYLILQLNSFMILYHSFFLLQFPFHVFYPCAISDNLHSQISLDIDCN